MVEVIFEDNHLLVLNKPAVLATMGAAEGEPDLLTQAKAYLKTKYDKPGNVYLGVVSRLDAFVTGVIVFARTSKAASRLSEQFRQRTIGKTYRALVPSGHLPEAGQLENWIYKDDAARRMRCLAYSGRKNEDLVRNSGHGATQYADAKPCRLKFRKVYQTRAAGGIVPNDHDYDLLEIQLETGRKHQIRAQLAFCGCPIVGDRKYGSEEFFTRGIGLHCFQLEFDHPTLKKRLRFSTNSPKYWPKIN